MQGRDIEIKPAKKYALRAQENFVNFTNIFLTAQYIV